ncbi:MAG: septum formation protein Maf [Alphaproteobacteria bacterium]|nr:septum formation protein Maf [Alphaproteobacteria bacterium]MBV9541377.1 septum formation protein Maf [Alphaproteobacteria bacterium]MBV9904037.1 septum formation protein Maf [Alphaproteobacteria bacterium]
MISPRDASPIASSNPPLLVLASESPRRKALLAQAGIVPDEIRAAAIDESIHRKEQPRAYAFRLAGEKARAVAAQWNGAPAVFLAADTVVALGTRVLPKASTNGEVRDCLKRLSGRAHRVLTAIAALDMRGNFRTRTVETRLIFDRLSGEAIEAYVQCGEGLGKAGGYAVQGRAEIFVRRLSGSYSNVVGLPLREAIGLLRASGYPC